MFNQSHLLMVIAGYLRKANHPEETDIQIAAGVRADIAKAVRAEAAYNISAGIVDADDVAEYMNRADSIAAALEGAP